ncbi:MAG TPA: hypothetical protein VJX31_03740 [Casimicrobiaceae bacterium]|nr:hypothetical protein [Casimicrobiaceae bacterium]
MNIRRQLELAALIAIGSVVGTNALAQQPRSATAVPDTTRIEYINGGFGTEEADRMRALSTEFPVRLTFSRHNGTQNSDEFVADVNIRVTDSGGRTVLNVASQGPIFLLRLPEGSYAIEAEHNGETKTRRFDVVAGKRQEIALSWTG